MVNDKNVWESEVRDYELDFQGIVNNANYFHYFEHARHHYLTAIGIDVVDWHNRGYDLVLIHTDLSFCFPLKSRDIFYVTSTLAKVSRLKFAFIQEIYKKSENKLVAKAINTAACINREKRPCMPEELDHLLNNIAVEKNK